MNDLWKVVKELLEVFVLLADLFTEEAETSDLLSETFMEDMLDLALFLLLSRVRNII